MPTSAQVRTWVEEGVAVGLLVVAIAGGWYLVDPSVNELAFVNVGWWNIRDLSTASRTDEEIRQIAAGVEGIEVLAVGEVNDPDALKRIAQELGPSWEWDATDGAIGRTNGSAEYYGFLWDSDAVHMVGNIQVDADPNDDIDREPAWATFQTEDGNLDFTVIAVHITWGDRVANRQAEIRALDEVWQRTQTLTQDDDDLILVGDFNRNVGDSSFDELLAIPGMVRANEGTGPTHISSNSTYDQIFLSIGATREWTGEYDLYRFDEVQFADNDVAARLAVSDHRPVWITLYISESDDD